MRVLIVDDSPLVREVITRTLGEEGFEVAAAPDGAAALRLADELRPDALTLDVQMPVLDGLATLKRLMTVRPTPTLMVSALTAEDSRVTFECLRYGALDYVQKPGGDEGITLDETRGLLVERLRQVMRIEPARLGLRRPSLPRRAPLEAKPAERVLVLAGGRTALAPLLRDAAALGELTGAGIICLDVTPAVAHALAGYLGETLGREVRRPGGTGALHDGVLTLLSTAEPHVVVSTPEGPALLPFRPSNGALPGSTTEALFASAAEAFGARACAVLLSGAPEGSLDGLEHAARHGAACAAQAPLEALEPAPLDLATRLGLAYATSDVARLLRGPAWREAEPRP